MKLKLPIIILANSKSFIDIDPLCPVHDNCLHVVSSNIVFKMFLVLCMCVFPPIFAMKFLCKKIIYISHYSTLEYILKGGVTP